MENENKRLEDMTDEEIDKAIGTNPKALKGFTRRQRIKNWIVAHKEDIILGTISIVGGIFFGAVNHKMAEKNQSIGYKKGYKTGEWDGICKGCGIGNRKVDAIGYSVQTTNNPKSFADDEQFTSCLDSHGVNIDDVVQASKVYNFITKDMYSK
jgi:hypothetical protein